MSYWFRVLPEQTGKQKVVAIVREVADKYGFHPDEIFGPSRRADIVRARQESMYRSRQETKFSLPQLGILFDRDHTTILHAIERHTARLTSSTGFVDYDIRAVV